ncbi:unnamed protein product [Adineta ricciae]|uniref:Reverse transcriptase domain-containing protein n=1 Tax=Adineta ricciae TaxID=249248 RepID=A0A814YPK5_ADIRI|nr:unnamed protein product [Adineta ricciae]
MIDNDSPSTKKDTSDSQDHNVDTTSDESSPSTESDSEINQQNTATNSNIEDHPVVIKSATNNSNIELLSPITKSDIENALKRTKRDTTKGLDLVTVQEAKQLANVDRLVVFNIWLGSRRIPSGLKINRTTLIPKENIYLDKITNWRPTTISSVLLRLFNKIIGYRMSKYFEIDKRQLGLTPINGCSMNILWLHHLLKHARLEKREVNVCLIDVAKAFDSVPRDSIFRALT